MTEEQYDVLIIGAGACGLMAARHLITNGKRVAVIEARDRTGGRIFTKNSHPCGTCLELGAEFVHGNLPCTQSLLREWGTSLKPFYGPILQFSNGSLKEQTDFIEGYELLQKKFKQLRDDIPVQQFLNEYFFEERYSSLRASLQDYVEGYYAADMNKASTWALCEELNKGDEEQYRIRDGYIKVIELLHKDILHRKGSIFLSCKADRVNWKKEGVEVSCNDKLYRGRKLLVTVPLGVLKQRKISFSPGLPMDVLNAIDRLGFGPALKTLLLFDEPIWHHAPYFLEQNKELPSFIFSNEKIPTWWTHAPDDLPLLSGWAGGPRAETLRHLGPEKLREVAIQSLATILQLDENFIAGKIKQYETWNWMEDPFSFGAYAYDVVGGTQLRNVLNQPLEGTIFFGGEALQEGPMIGTVEAALLSGRFKADEILSFF